MSQSLNVFILRFRTEYSHNFIILQKIIDFKFNTKIINFTKKIKKQMKAIGKFFAEFDLFEAPAYLRIREDDTMKSCPIGAASFIVSCLFVIHHYLNVIEQKHNNI